MKKRKSVLRKKTLPLYRYKVEGFPVLNGYTWKELAKGYTDDGRLLPCPECGRWTGWLGERCPEDGAMYPRLEDALEGVSRRKLLVLIRKLAQGRMQSTPGWWE